MDTAAIAAATERFHRSRRRSRHNGLSKDGASRPLAAFDHTPIPVCLHRTRGNASLLVMRVWCRFLLIALLAIGLPVQGWSAARMSVQMAMPMSESMQVASSPSMVALADHLDHACCDPQSALDELDASGGSCGDSCHCCISAAPARTVGLAVQDTPPHAWLAAPAYAGSTAPPATPDKPPKA